MVTSPISAKRARRIRVPRPPAWGDWLREGPSALVPLAVLVGAVTGLGAVGFRALITAFTRMFTGYDDYSGLGRVASAHWPWLGFWFLLLAPVVAGAIYGPLVHRFAPEARGHGVPEVMYAVSHRGGRIAPQVSLVKALASALCIGGGGSVGREGPIVQIGSAAGSTVAQLLRLNTPRMRLLVACGAAAGISATFNAPLAGAFFALELILRNFAAESFGAVVLASVTADVVGQDDARQPPIPVLAVVRRAQPCRVSALHGTGSRRRGRRGGLREDPLPDRRRLRLAVARTGVGAPGGRRRRARRTAHRAAPDVRRRLPGSRERGRGQVRDRDAPDPDGRQDDRHQPHHRDRRFRRSVRPDPVHRRHGRNCLRHRRPSAYFPQ